MGALRTDKPLLPIKAAGKQNKKQEGKGRHPAADQQEYCKGLHAVSFLSARLLGQAFAVCLRRWGAQAGTAQQRRNAPAWTAGFSRV